MTRAATWNGRRGAVILGPTEHRVARWLADRTRHGRVTIRTVDLATALELERSEAYRITARLRSLGLFGIENDRSGARGGRRYWRTAIEHDGARPLERHRETWARIRAWAASSRIRLRERIAAIRPPANRGPGIAGVDRPECVRADPGMAAGGSPRIAGGRPVLEGLIRGGLSPHLIERFAT